MKHFFALGLTVLLMVFGLSGCGCDDGRNVGLVFVNDSDAAIVTVWAVFENRVEEAGYADGSPMERGDFFGFETGKYPVTVVVYEDFGQKELTRVTIRTAPPEGKRWYVTARGGRHGLKLAAETCWPEGV